MLTLNDFWAKSEPFQSVVTHGIVSGLVSKTLYDEFLSAGQKDLLRSALQMEESQCKSYLAYLVSLHDIGKLEFNFQGQDKKQLEKLRKTIAKHNLPPTRVRHEKTGRMSLRSIWRVLQQNKKTVELFSSLIGAHHQGKTGKGEFSETSIWYDYQKQFELKMRECFLQKQEIEFPSIESNNQGSTSAILLGVMILSDWISSSPLFYDVEEWIESSNAEDIVNDKTKEFLHKSELAPSRIDWEKSFHEIWPNIPKEGMRELQRKVEELLLNSPDEFMVVLIEAPMGEGKTEAGMYAALQMAKAAGMDGFYVALPTAATANQMVLRMRNLLDMHESMKTVRLLHSMAWLTDEQLVHSQDDADEAARWLLPSKRALLGQFAVGTIDQAMLAATMVKYGVLRLLGLSNKVLLIDEIHSYDAYMSEIIVRLLEWCKALRIPVVMLSATLPPLLKKRLLSPFTNEGFSEGYPLITAINDNGSITESIISKTSHCLDVHIQIHSLLGKPSKIAELAVQKVEKGGCLCVLMNTVKESQEVFKEIQKIYQGDLLLFHAQFPVDQRDEIEKECLRRYGKDKSNRPEQSILVATQVVEQSLDVDFDTMITAVAPIDLVLQRMGRVFRHDNSRRPDFLSIPSLVILISEGDCFGPSEFVYPGCLLQRTVDLLSDLHQVRIPEDIANLVKDAYDPALIPDDELALWMENQVENQVRASAADAFLINPPSKKFSPLIDSVSYDEEDSGYLTVKTRLGEPTVRVVLAEQNEIDFLSPLIEEKNGTKYVHIQNKGLAERLMRKSAVIRTSRLGSSERDKEYIEGQGLLLGIRIYPAKGGRCELNNGKIISFDKVLGVLIQGGEQ